MLIIGRCVHWRNLTVVAQDEIILDFLLQYQTEVRLFGALALWIPQGGEYAINESSFRVSDFPTFPVK